MPQPNYRLSIPTIQELVNRLDGTGPDRKGWAHFPHLCGEPKRGKRPLSVIESSDGRFGFKCHVGCSGEDAERAIREALGSAYLEIAERPDAKPPQIGGARDVARELGDPEQILTGQYSARCPICSERSLTIWNLNEHQTPYLGLSCECGASYDALHKAISAVTSERSLTWVQAADYRTADGPVRHNIRFDGERFVGKDGEEVRSLWGNSGGPSLTNHEPHKWADGDGSRGIVVEGAKAAAALVSAGVGNSWAIYSGATTSSLHSQKLALIAEKDVVVWPDRDSLDKDGSRPGAEGNARRGRHLGGGWFHRPTRKRRGFGRRFGRCRLRRNRDRQTGLLCDYLHAACLDAVNSDLAP